MERLKLAAIEGVDEGEPDDEEATRVRAMFGNEAAPERFVQRIVAVRAAVNDTPLPRRYLLERPEL